MQIKNKVLTQEEYELQMNKMLEQYTSPDQLKAVAKDMYSDTYFMVPPDVEAASDDMRPNCFMWDAERGEFGNPPRPLGVWAKYYYLEEYKGDVPDKDLNWQILENLNKSDFEESKHPRDKDGKFTSKEFGESGGNVKFSRNPDITSKKTQDFIESEFNRIPKNERVKSTVKRIIAYDNPEDVYDAAMNLGIEPDVDPEIGVVRGFYDFSTQTIHTSTWDGYDNTSKNLYHEIAHSILGMDEDAVNSWVDAHYTEGKTDTSLESIKTEFFDSLYDKGDLTPGEEELGNVISLEDDFYHAHYVVEDGELKSGIAWHEDENYVYIDHFGSVKPGYGWQTLEHVLQLARDKGKGIAGQSTPEAEGFYRHFGFDLDEDGNFDIPPTSEA